MLVGSLKLLGRVFWALIRHLAFSPLAVCKEPSSSHLLSRGLGIHLENFSSLEHVSSQHTWVPPGFSTFSQLCPQRSCFQDFPSFEFGCDISILILIYFLNLVFLPILCVGSGRGTSYTCSFYHLNWEQRWEFLLLNSDDFDTWPSMEPGNQDGVAFMEPGVSLRWWSPGSQLMTI